MTGSTGRSRLALVLAVPLVLGACGTEGPTVSDSPAPPRTPVARPTEVPRPDGEVRTGRPVTVLEGQGHGPELCFAVAQSLPPQCSGVPLLGWDWATMGTDAETVSGVTWGEYVVTGTFDGTSLTVSGSLPGASYTAPPGVDDEGSPTDPACDEPDGGWVVDATRVAQDDLDAAFATAAHQGDVTSPYLSYGMDPVDQRVVNLLVYGTDDDVAAVASAVRAVWGGGLCVVHAQHSRADLARGKSASERLPGWQGSSTGIDQVQASVVYDDGSMQAWLDQQFGAGAVHVGSALVDVS